MSNSKWLISLLALLFVPLFHLSAAGPYFSESILAENLLKIPVKLNCLASNTEMSFKVSLPIKVVKTAISRVRERSQDAQIKGPWTCDLTNENGSSLKKFVLDYSDLKGSKSLRIFQDDSSEIQLALGGISGEYIRRSQFENEDLVNNPQKSLFEHLSHKEILRGPYSINVYRLLLNQTGVIKELKSSQKYTILAPSDVVFGNFLGRDSYTPTDLAKEVISKFKEANQYHVLVNFLKDSIIEGEYSIWDLSFIPSRTQWAKSILGLDVKFTFINFFDSVCINDKCQYLYGGVDKKSSNGLLHVLSNAEYLRNYIR